MSRYFSSLVCFFVVSACGLQDSPAPESHGREQSALGQAISSIAPTSGTQGTAVVLTGTGFTGTTFLSINGRSSPYVVNSDTQISTTVPAGARSGAITIQTPGGSASSPFFTVVSSAPPTVTGFAPASGGTGIAMVVAAGRTSPLVQGRGSSSAM